MKFWFGREHSAPQPNAAEPSQPAERVSAEPEPVAAEPAPATEEVIGAEQPPAAAAPTAATPPPPEAPPLVRPQLNQKVLYYEFMNGLYDAVLILDQNGHIVDCNKRVTPVLGYNREELWDMPVSNLVKGLDLHILKQMKDAIDNGQPVLINAKCQRKDGSTFHGEMGAGQMRLMGTNLVLTVRNIEKRVAEVVRKVREQTAKGTPRAIVKVVPR